LDQKQHIEITRDIAENFKPHLRQNAETPEGVISEDVQSVPA
jgi:tryptophanyl-tRNA synthetase